MLNGIAQSGVIMAVIKTADQAIINATLTDITDLMITVPAGETLYLLGSIFYDSTLSNDLNMDFALTGDATMPRRVFMGTVSAASGSAASIQTLSSDSAARSYGGGRNAGAAKVIQSGILSAVVQGGAGGGTVKLRMAKLANTDTNTPDDDLTVYAYSHIIALSA